MLSYSVIAVYTEYRDAFALFDKRGDGKIDSDQSGNVMRALGLNLTEAEVKKTVQKIDPKGKTKLSSLVSIQTWSGIFLRFSFLSPFVHRYKTSHN